ncbi:MFS general substrate transporter [Hesseltinella vesiculosa]|uniref:MFS general substrate transporter n=1 Tax=Hesseltinella vesiculosa TaxID=101127 RepID=A0A1X2GND4_9FUNG|nr:MFS general substrate transporter [Hesseltinella vesiculosa]
MTDQPLNEHTPLLEQQINKKQESWKDTIPYLRSIFSSNFILLCAGLNDGSVGIIIPQLKEHYGISNSVVSSLFLSSAFGFFSAALFNGYLVHRLGQRGTMYLGGSVIVLAYIVLVQGVAFPVMCLFMPLLGGGYGLLDGAVNVYVANIPMATMNLNICHAVYGLGAMISPLVGTYLMAHHISWRGMYVFLLAMALLDILLIVICFYDVDMEGQGAEKDLPSSPVSDGDPALPGPTTPHHGSSLQRRAILNRMTLLGAAYILTYAGVEVCIGGWGYTYLRDARMGDPIAMGHVISGYWAGLCLGRLVLGWVAGRYGEKPMVSLFTMTAIVLIFLIWLIPVIWVDSLCMLLIGFFIGPMFPCCVTLASKVLPRRMQPTAIGFMAAFGAGGAAFFPFVSGQLAGVIGIQFMPLCWLVCAVIMQGKK